MKHLVEERIHLSYLAYDKRKIQDYFQNILRLAHPVDNIEDQKYILRLLFSDFSYNEIKINRYLESFIFFKNSFLTQITSNIIQLSEELKSSSLEEFNEKIIDLRKNWIEFNPEYLTNYIEELQIQYNKKTVIPLYQSKNWSDTNCVFHATKLEHIINNLTSGKIEGYTRQKYWKDGRRRIETESDYNDYRIMKGISTTRSLDFAKNWGGIILVLDLEKIKHNTKVVPYAWNYHIKPSQYPQFRTNPKKETEEFVILSQKDRQYTLLENPEFKKEYEAALKNNDLEAISYYEKNMTNTDSSIQEPEGFLNLDKTLKGIFIMSSTIDIFGIDNDKIQQVIQHPLFLGILEK